MCHNLEYNLFTRQYSPRTAEKNVSTTGLLEVEPTHRRVSQQYVRINACVIFFST